MSDWLAAQVEATMRTCLARRRFVSAVLVFGVILATAGGLAPIRVAQAGCGEYVLINGRPAAYLHQTARIWSAHRQADLYLIAADLATAPPRELPARGLPCDGPHCGKQIPLPLPYDLPTMPLRSADQWASLLTSDEPAERSWSTAYWCEQISWREVCLPRLDRPPRV